MPKLLHIECSPRKVKSHSINIANEFLSAYRLKNPNAEIETLNVWYADLPDFNGEILEAKYAVINSDTATQEQADAWSKIQVLFDHFNQFDTYVFSVPMWNFSIPYRLKQYIDVITQPGMAWSYSPEESYQGLLKNKKAVVVYSSGDGYAEGTGFEAYDLQKPYVNLWLNFIGISEINTINVEATLFPDRSTEDQAKRDAIKLGVDFS